MPAHCKCGTPLGRCGKCPALCEPVPQPAPKYTGPLVVGRSHMSKLAAPVYVAPRRYERGQRVRVKIKGKMIIDAKVQMPGDVKITVVDNRNHMFNVLPKDIIEVLAA